ncbi:hypothetical protein CCS77_0105 [Campylobacter concisus]|uniref:Uncharacterized protein n=1 Tax=Campylobacter concisus TaxID=199 RepID=A0A2R4NXM2_9BACT|nr:hypothetical protein CCS77_0105 [Campylobacter concisus]
MDKFQNFAVFGFCKGYGSKFMLVPISWRLPCCSFSLRFNIKNKNSHLDQQSSIM